MNSNHRRTDPAASGEHCSPGGASDVQSQQVARDQVRSPSTDLGEDREATAKLAAGLEQALSDTETVQVSHVSTTVVVEFPESDFAVTLREDPIAEAFESTIAATVRAPEPDLSTWWVRWDVAGSASELVARHLMEIQSHRRRFQDMVSDDVRAG